MNINKLSMEEKIGQRFIFGVNSNNVDCIINLIKKAYVGGVVLYKKNYNNYKEMLDLIKKMKKANVNNPIPLFIAIDQEGGLVNRLPSEIHVLKNNYDVSMKDYKLVYESGNITGKILYETGINMNLAPVLDIYNNSKSKALYKRCFYGNYKEVYNAARENIKGFNDNNIISVVKHYPGHGASKFDSHIFAPIIFNYKDVLDKHIKPFELAIKDNIEVIMMSHLTIWHLTGLLPASISDKFIYNYLRKKYDGVIMTDEINMLKRNIFYRFNYLNKALKSSNDLILVKIKDENEGYSIINKYKKLIIRYPQCEKKLNDNLTRIINLKEKHNINDSINFNGIDIDLANKEIDRINSLVE